jgi:hypothetical protein
MKLLKEGNRNMKVHPEVLNQFNDLVRFNFNPIRKGKEVNQIRQEMRDRDIQEQKALITGKCDIETKLIHEKDCLSKYPCYPCDCIPKKEIKFIQIESKFALNLEVYNYWTSNVVIDDTEGKDL